MSNLTNEEALISKDINLSHYDLLLGNYDEVRQIDTLLPFETRVYQLR
ncbi:Uncharacterised protein [Staphylococcus aureus]|nr:Uncharacterised protein [Staphylococcus aureus]